MDGHFFGSSALVKLYHPEVGTPVVDQIVNAPHPHLPPYQKRLKGYRAIGYEMEPQEVVVENVDTGSQTG